MDLHILFNIFVMFGITVVVIFVCSLLKIPHLIGYLLTGILLSPNTLPLMREAHEVETYAEIGVILLLFTVGLEFSFAKLKKIKDYALVGGPAQVLLTIGLAGGLIWLIVGSATPAESVFWGFLYALSSTAIVIKLLQDNLKMNTPYGKFILAVLIFQDIVIVPLMLLTPILAGQGGNPMVELLILVGKLAAMVGVSYLAARFVIPPFLKLVMRLQSQEVFLIATIFLVLGIALLTSWLGLSLALGAFIAGLIVAETDYNRLAISCFLPFRYVFISFFFISMGMLLDWRIFLTETPAIAFWFGFTLLVKAAAGTLAARLVRIPWPAALASGLGIAQIGEFSFVLAQSGLSYDLISENNYQIFLAVSILLMGVTPLLLNNAEAIANRLLRPFARGKVEDSAVRS